jgi:hypothetical protein
VLDPAPSPRTADPTLAAGPESRSPLPRALSGRLRSLVGNPIFLFLLLTLATAAFVATAPFTPRPSIPILGSPAWTSWFDDYVVLPLLTGLLVIVFARVGRLESLVIGALCVLPMVLGVFDSYYWSTTALTYSIRTWQGQLLAGIGVSAALCGTLFLISRLKRTAGLAEPRTRRVLRVAALVSIALALFEILLRPLTTSDLPLSSVGDVGISNWWGGYDLWHHVNPFAVGVPPWGGPITPPYGPVSALAGLPFTVVPPDAGVHLASLAFALLSAFMIYEIVKLYNRPAAATMALLFLAMPLTPYAIVAGVTPHFAVTFLILASLYFYLKQSSLLAGAVLALAVLTLYFPILLVIPFLLFGESKRLPFLASFAAVAGVGGYVSVVLLPGRNLAGGLSATSAGGTRFIYYGEVLGKVAGLEVFLGLIALLTIVSWFAWGRSLRQPSRLLFGASAMMIGLPAVIAFTYAPYYLWSVAVALVAIASLPTLATANTAKAKSRPEGASAAEAATQVAPHVDPAPSIGGIAGREDAIDPVAAPASD